MTNIFSLADMTDKHRVTFDSGADQAFIVHADKGPVHFERVTNKLYARIPKSEGIKASPPATALMQSIPLITGVNMMKTVPQRQGELTPQQRKRADRAMALIRSLAYPTIEDVKAILRSNQIKDNPVTEEDLALAIRAYGEHLDGGALKGKTTRTKPAPVQHSTVSIPPELVEANRKIELCIDGMFVNLLAFLTTIDTTVRYRTAQYVPTCQIISYQEAISQVFHIYSRAGFKITYVHADLEFKPLLDKLQQLFVFQPNYATTNEHVPQTERNNRTIKERVRALIHGSPFKCLPRTVLKYIVMEVARKLNFFPAKGGISPYYSPRAILHHRA
eukprot:scaffold12392_cov145-Amphora_coffeaeformis.AAC.1